MSAWFDESHQIAVTVARKVHRKYHVYFDMQDVAQELTVWILRRQDKIEEWLDHPKGTEEYKMGVKKLGKTLTRHADKYCRRLKAQKLGYELRDEQFYSEVTLSELLPFVWSDVVNTVDNSKPKVSGGGNPAEGGNYVIQLFDIRRALARLNEMDRDVLELRYADNLSFKELSIQLAVSETTAHRKVDGALRRLTNELGGTNPWERREDAV